MNSFLYSILFISLIQSHAMEKNSNDEEITEVIKGIVKTIDNKFPSDTEKVVAEMLRRAEYYTASPDNSIVKKILKFEKKFSYLSEDLYEEEAIEDYKLDRIKKNNALFDKKFYTIQNIINKDSSILDQKGSLNLIDGEIVFTHNKLSEIEPNNLENTLEIFHTIKDLLEKHYCKHYCQTKDTIDDKNITIDDIALEIINNIANYKINLAIDGMFDLYIFNDIFKDIAAKLKKRLKLPTYEDYGSMLKKIYVKKSIKYLL